MTEPGLFDSGKYSKVSSSQECHCQAVELLGLFDVRAVAAVGNDLQVVGRGLLHLVGMGDWNHHICVSPDEQGGHFEPFER